MRIDTPEVIVKQGIETILKGKSYTVVGTHNYLYSLLPRFIVREAIIHLLAGMTGKKINNQE